MPAGRTGYEVFLGTQQTAQEIKESRSRELVNLANAEAGQLEIQQAEQEIQAERAALDQLAAGKVNDPSRLGAPESIIDTEGDDSRGAVLEKLGQLMIAGGATKKGSEYLKAGVEIRNKESEIDARADTATKTRLDNIISTSDLFSRTVGTAKNESEWRYGLAQFRRNPDAVRIFGEENLAALEGMEYDPDVVDYFNQQALSFKDKATLDMQQQTQDRLERNERSLQAYRNATLGIAQARHAESVRHNRVMEKNAGKSGSSAPTSDQLKTAETAIANLVFKGVVPQQVEEYVKGQPSRGGYVAFKSGAQNIASRAMDLVNSNRGLTFVEAVNRATIESIADGEWESIKDEEKNPVGTTFKSKIPSVDAPAPLPSSKNQLRTGGYYITGRGVAKWDGKSFVIE